MAVAGIYSRTTGLITVPVDLRLIESHSAEAVPTAIPIEDGSIVTDHVILQPDQVTVDVMISNHDPGALTRGLRAAAAWNSFKGLLRLRGLYQVLTWHEIYPDMALTAMSADNSAPYPGNLIASLTFTEINRSSPERVRVTLPEATPGSQGGRVPASGPGDNPARAATADRSLLRQALDNLRVSRPDATEADLVASGGTP